MKQGETKRHLDANGILRVKRVGELMTEGYATSRDISEALKREGFKSASHVTVSRDMKEVYAVWAAEHVKDKNHALTLAEARHNRLIREAHEGWLRSKRRRERNKGKKTTGGAKGKERTEIENITEERDGDPRFLSVASKEQDALNRLRGLYKDSLTLLPGMNEPDPEFAELNGAELQAALGLARKLQGRTDKAGKE